MPDDKKLNKDICTFSIIDKEDSRYNEQDNINLISKELKSEHKNIYVSKNNFFKRMKKLPKILVSSSNNFLLCS